MEKENKKYWANIYIYFMQPLFLVIFLLLIIWNFALYGYFSGKIYAYIADPELASQIGYILLFQFLSVIFLILNIIFFYRKSLYSYVLNLTTIVLSSITIALSFVFSEYFLVIAGVMTVWMIANFVYFVKYKKYMKTLGVYGGALIIMFTMFMPNNSYAAWQCRSHTEFGAVTSQMITMGDMTNAGKNAGNVYGTLKECGKECKYGIMGIPCKEVMESLDDLLDKFTPPSFWSYIGGKLTSFSSSQINELENQRADMINKGIANESSMDRVFTMLIATAISDEGLMGKVLRYTWSDSLDFMNYGPNTIKFFDETDKVTGEGIYVVRNIYSKVSKIDFEDGVIRNSEQTLEDNKGACRDQARLLSEAINRHGINSEVMVTPNHAWVRVTTDQGVVFDLDTVQYETFVPLKPRSVQM